MADTVGAVPQVGPTLVASTAPAPPVIELAHQPPAAVLLASTLTAVVVGRGGNGALLLRTDYGTLALKTTLDFAPGSRVDLRLQPGPPTTVILLNVAEANAPATATTAASALAPSAGPPPAAGNASAPASPAATTPPAQLVLGTEVEATLIAVAANDPSAAGLALGTRLVLRLALPSPGAPPPPPVGPLPASLAGTVTASVGQNGGRTALDTPLGTLLLDQRLALPPGTRLSFTALAMTPPAAALAARDMGMVVQAQVLSPAPGDGPDVLPSGTALLLRLAALPDATTAAGMTGTIAAGSSSETLLDTPLGMLALDRRLALPPGTLLGLQRLTASPPDQPAEAPLAQRVGWPALDQALSVLDRAAPELAARLRTDLAPTSGQQLAGTLLFLMSALGSGAWPGLKANSALDGAGRRDLRARLDGDVAELRQLANAKSGDWRVYVLPLLDGAWVSPVRLYLRRFAGNAAGPADQGTRFVLDVDLSRLGAVQLDGLVRSQRFDLVMRSHRAITADMRKDISEVFHNATSAAGLTGDITFTTASRFAVAPLDALRGHVGVSA